MNPQHQCGKIFDMRVLIDDVAQVFGANVRRIRERRGWSQSELARHMKDFGWEKYSQVAVSRTEEGSRAVRLDEAMALATVLLVELKDLLVLDETVTELRERIASVSRAARAVQRGLREYDRAQQELRASLDKAGEKLESSESGSKVDALRDEIERAKRRVDQPYEAFFVDEKEQPHLFH